MKAFLAFFILSVVLFNIVHADSEESNESESKDTKASESKESNEKPSETNTQTSSSSSDAKQPASPESTYVVTESYEVTDNFPESERPQEHFAVHVAPVGGPAGLPSAPFKFPQFPPPPPPPAFPSNTFSEPFFQRFRKSFPANSAIFSRFNFGPDF